MPSEKVRTHRANFVPPPANNSLQSVFKPGFFTLTEERQKWIWFGIGYELGIKMPSATLALRLIFNVCDLKSYARCLPPHSNLLFDHITSAGQNRVQNTHTHTHVWHKQPNQQKSNTRGRVKSSMNRPGRHQCVRVVCMFVDTPNLCVTTWRCRPGALCQSVGNSRMQARIYRLFSSTLHTDKNTHWVACRRILYMDTHLSVWWVFEIIFRCATWNSLCTNVECRARVVQKKKMFTGCVYSYVTYIYIW